ncbi:hypothetical protein LCGC14_1294020 [marine sediment metagenome]|uniref:C2H2-type domain-containing protein n=1 Tax=marine sediment metagenome TaxID=412755 RepID=A0A0F9LCD7_9ZZZZ
MEIGTIYFDPKFVERAKAGEWPAARVPKWLLDGNYTFQHDSMRYFVKAGERCQFPINIAIHAVTKGLFQADPLTGAPVKPITLIKRYKAGTSTENCCPVCGVEQRNLSALATHIEAHAAERAFDASKGQNQVPETDVEPSGREVLKLTPEEGDAGSSSPSQHPEAV